MQCWQCGVEPLDVVETTTLSQSTPQYMPRSWPDGDHEHAVIPPSPEELVARAHVSLRAIQELL